MCQAGPGLGSSLLRCMVGVMKTRDWCVTLIQRNRSAWAPALLDWLQCTRRYLSKMSDAAGKMEKLGAPACDALMLQLPTSPSVRLHSEQAGFAGRLGPRKLGPSVDTPDAWVVWETVIRWDYGRPACWGRSNMLSRSRMLTGRSFLLQLSPAQSYLGHLDGTKAV